MFENNIDNSNALAPDTTGLNKTPFAKPILYVIAEEDPGPAYNGNCWGDNGPNVPDSPVANNHISFCP